MSSRSPIVRPPGSREFVDDVLAELAADHWSPSSWLRFLWRCAVRSAQQAAAHRRAFLELTLLHFAMMRGRPRPWPLASWLLAVTHLGLLGDARRGALVANHLSLLRGNLPSLSPSAAPWTAGVALVTDWLDGRLARARKEETAFGAYADPLADLVFWSWYVFRNECNPWIRAATVLAWPLPAAVITAAYFALGQSLDYPRPAMTRLLSAAFQCWIGTRAFGRWISSAAPRTSG
ncbi:MAG: CDP-alcohol phosphatidyltransferase family protein [Candidatus Dormibacter sp.]